MFSKTSISYLDKNKINSYLKFRKKKNLNHYISLIKKGSLPRPYYALGMLLAANQALNLGLNKISVLEISIDDYSGLQDLFQHKLDIESVMPITFEIIHLNAGSKNFNKCNNIRDRLDFFNLMKSSTIKKNIKKNSDIKIYKKNFVKDLDLIKKNLKNPLGFIIFDVNNFTLTNEAFKILNISPKKILPKPLLYFDHFYRSSEFEGEFYSIKKFNDKNKFRKISDILELPEQLSTSWNKWIYLAKRMKYFINFKHPKFKYKIKTII